MQGNQMAILEQFRESMMGNRVGEVFRMAGEGRVGQRMGEVFRGIGGMMVRKQRELERAAELNRFYRSCIVKILQGQQVSHDMDGEYTHISPSCKEIILDLQTYVVSLSTKSERAAVLTNRLQEMQQRLNYLREGKEQATLALQNLEARMELQRSRAEEMMNSLRQEFEVRQEVQNRKMSTLQSDLQAKMTVIIDLQNKNRDLLRKQQEIERQLRMRNEFSDSISLQSKRLSQIICQKEEQINTLRNENKMLQTSAKQLEMSFSLQASIIMSINNQHQLPLPLSQALRKTVGREVASVDRLYSFKQQHARNFHESIDNRDNILLVCLTAKEELIGAFTSSSFRLDSSISELSAKAFIFGIIDDEITINPLKGGRESVLYDWDYLIFGNEELCIQKGSNVVTSCLPNAVESQLHYRRTKDQDYFMKAVGEEGRVQIKNYQIFQVLFEPPNSDAQ